MARIWTEEWITYRRHGKKVIIRSNQRVMLNENLTL
jgi:hypothetical protein